MNALSSAESSLEAEPAEFEISLFRVQIRREKTASRRDNYECKNSRRDERDGLLEEVDVLVVAEDLVDLRERDEVDIAENAVYRQRMYNCVEHSLDDDDSRRYSVEADRVFRVDGDERKHCSDTEKRDEFEQHIQYQILPNVYPKVAANEAADGLYRARQVAEPVENPTDDEVFGIDKQNCSEQRYCECCELCHYQAAASSPHGEEQSAHALLAVVQHDRQHRKKQYEAAENVREAVVSRKCQAL